MDRLHSRAAPVVTQRDANAYPSDQLVAILRSGILQRVLDPEEVPHPRWPDRCRVAVRRTAQGLYAVACEEEEYFEAFTLQQEDTWVYEIPVPYLVEHLPQENGITGTGKPVIQGMQLVGRKHLDGFGTAEVFLCLPNDDPETFRAGEPVFDPLPLIVRVVRTTEPPPGPPQPAPESFVLCREQQTFLRHLTDLGDGVVALIKVHDGLPVQLEIHLPA
jgi:hypothetical protein